MIRELVAREAGRLLVRRQLGVEHALGAALAAESIGEVADALRVLFCGAGWRSALAARTLQDMGLTNVAHIDGGFTEWVKQGAPTETLEQRKARKPA